MVAVSRDEKAARGARGALSSGPAAPTPPAPASSSSSQPSSSPGGALPAGLLPALSTPKGGGALRGIGETFSTNPATGTASLSIPIATSPGRAGFGPALELNYDSGAGNGPFGIGWRLSTPSIARKTDKGLPRYDDAGAPDTFVLSGAEDLVPVLSPEGPGARPDAFDVGDYRVQRYRPRTEGLFARIERWAHRATGDAHWRALTRDNVLNVYGRSASARVADPADPSRVFSWLLEETRDDRGNVARYVYKAEDGAGVDPGRASESNRFEATAGGGRAFLATAQRYLKRIVYGNRAPVLDREAAAPPADDPAGPAAEANWLFEVVFDYGEHDDAAPTPAEARPWAARPDPFSSFRPTFELRTYRLCRRVLMFHRFAELGAAPCLVRSTDFAYDEGPVVTYLASATQAGYKRAAGATAYERATLPPLELGYVKPEIHDELRALDRASLEGIPAGVDGAAAQWVDLDGEGTPGVLVAAERAWFYKRNLGGGRLAPPALEPRLPSPARPGVGGQQLVDLGGDGNLDLVCHSPPLAGYFERTPEGDWAPFAALPALPAIDWRDPNLRFLDLDGDGFPDVLMTERDAFVWYRSRAKQGFEPAAFVTKPRDELGGPAVVFSDEAESIHLADMSGDGLVDIVRVRNGEVCYWPNLGYGRFGRKVTLDRSPRFDAPERFDPRRVRFADVDGSGTSDVVYAAGDGVRLYFNESGNGLSAARSIEALPLVDSLAGLSVVDLLGRGTACLVRSSPLPGEAARSVVYVDLMGGKKPHVLDAVKNNLGAETRFYYAPSTEFFLRDQAAGRAWLTKLPFPVQVLERVERRDLVAGSKLVTRFAYHHGYFDAHEREFRGFACVEQWDAEPFVAGPPPASPGAAPAGGAFDLPPVRTVTWYHTGAWLERERLESALAAEYYRHDAQAPLLPDTSLPAGLGVGEARAAARALRGRLLRQEIYAEDGAPEAAHPYRVSERDYAVRLLQRAAGEAPAVFFVHPRDAVELHYERSPGDPRLQQESVLEVDDFGNVTKSVSLGYPRRAAAEPEQARLWAVVTERAFASRAGEADWYRVGVPIETTTSELRGLAAPAGGILSAAELGAALASAVEAPYEAAATGGLQKRIVERQRQFYYRESSTADEHWRDPAGPLPWGEISPRALRHHALRLALTPGLVAQVYGEQVDDEALRQEGGYVSQEGAWWAPSGRVVPDPAAFFLAAGAVDAFGERHVVRYDSYHLLPLETEDPLGNRVTAGERDAAGAVAAGGNDYRALAPTSVCDANRNRTRVEVDALGLVAASWRMGRAGDEGDDEANPGVVFRYDLHAWREGRGPAFSHSAAREAHRAGGDPFAADGSPRRQGFQHARTYSDGSGREVMKKAQAEPGEVPVLGPDGRLERRPDGAPKTRHEGDRWVGSGRTVFDNKGNAVKQYEPFGSATIGYEDEASVVEWGVAALLRYDPLGRLVRTDRPDGTHSALVFDAWRQETWDENDTVLASAWHERWRQAPENVAQLLPFVQGFAVAWATAPTELERAGELCRALGAPAPTAADLAWLAAPSGETPPVWQHALVRGKAFRRVAALAASHAGTPNVAHLDPLGRAFLEIADAGRDAAGAGREYPTRLELDVEGNQLSVTDARGVRTLAQSFDVLGRAVRVVSADAGEARSLFDAGGGSIRTWEARGYALRRRHDPLRRATHLFARRGGGEEWLAERVVYGEAHPEAEARNLRTRAYQTYDAAGVVTNARFDFGGNLVEEARRLARDYRGEPDWAMLEAGASTTQIEAIAAALLEAEAFVAASGFDALGRLRSRVTPDGSDTRPAYNEAGLLEAVAVSVRGAPAATFVEGVEYNARGQRTLARHGNGSTTRYEYDPATFRLARQTTTVAGGGGALQDLTLIYDPVGNVVAVADGVSYGNPDVSADGFYEYDALYRLVRAEGREHPGQRPGHEDAAQFGLPPAAHPNDWRALRRYRETYAYDAVGNVVEVLHRPLDAAGAGWSRRYQYASDNNRLRATSAPGDPDGVFAEAYDHDAAGNLTRMPHLPALDWDRANRLRRAKKQVQNGEGPANDVHFTYDASGRRVRKVYEHGGLVEERVYLGGYEVYRRRAVGAAEPEFERQTLHVIDGRRRVALVETKTVDAGAPGFAPSTRHRYQLENHLGSSALELDEAGRVFAYEEHYPFGGTAFRAADGATDVGDRRYRYTGKERDEETGLYYHGARYYAPWLARWCSWDPIATKDSFSQYAYVNDNPLTKVDPTGLAGDDPPAQSTKPPRPQAKLGDIKPYSQQGKAIWGADGSLATTHEHVMARGKQAALTFDPATGTSDFGAKQYRANTSLTLEHDTGLHKTHARRGGAGADNAVTAQLKAKAAAGQPINYRQEVFMSSIEQTMKSINETGSVITEAQVNRAALAQDGELFGIQRTSESLGKIGAGSADVDAALESFDPAGDAIETAPEPAAKAAPEPAAKASPAPEPAAKASPAPKPAAAAGATSRGLGAAANSGARAFGALGLLALGVDLAESKSMDDAGSKIATAVVGTVAFTALAAFSAPAAAVIGLFLGAQMFMPERSGQH